MIAEEMPTGRMFEPGAIAPTPTGELGEFTTGDIDALPDSGSRYELLDGALAISRSQGAVHQRAVLRLVNRLARVCPVNLEVLPGLEFRPTTQRSLLPDILVVAELDRETYECRLIVEVLSPATEVMDLTAKPELYAEAGVPSYWTFDPGEQLLTIRELVDGRYIERAVVKGTDAFEAELPYQVRIVPAELVSR